MISFSKVLHQLMTWFYSSFFSISCHDPTVNTLSDKEYSNTSSKETSICFDSRNSIVCFDANKLAAFSLKKNMNSCKIWFDASKSLSILILVLPFHCTYSFCKDISNSQEVNTRDVMGSHQPRLVVNVRAEFCQKARWNSFRQGFYTHRP